MSSQLDILPPEQAALIIKKKHFWKKTMWMAFISTILIPAIGITSFKIGDQSTAAASIHSSWDITVSPLITIMITCFLTALGFLVFLVFLVSLIRCLSLPKLPKK